MKNKIQEILMQRGLTAQVTIDELYALFLSQQEEESSKANKLSRSECCKHCKCIKCEQRKLNDSYNNQ